jgi:hypothetical protein
MEVDQIPIGLDNHDGAGDGLWVLTGTAEERLEGIGGTLTEFPEEPAVFAEIDPEHLRDGENILAVGDWRQDLIGHPVPKLEDPLLMAGGAEVPPFTRERQQKLVSARVAPDPSEPLGEVTAREVFLDDAPNGRSVEAVLLLIPRSVARLELGKVGVHTLVERCCLGVSRLVRPGDHPCLHGGEG